MVVGNQNIDTQSTGRSHARHARNSIIDSDDERGLALRRKGDDFRRKAIAELKTIRHKEIRRGEAPGTQSANDERRAGSSVRVEIPYHKHTAALAMSAQQLRSCRYALKCANRQHAL